MSWVRNANSREPKFTWEYLGTRVEADTKSEARALLKKKFKKLAWGVPVTKVENQGEGK